MIGYVINVEYLKLNVELIGQNACRYAIDANLQQFNEICNEFLVKFIKY